MARSSRYRVPLRRRRERKTDYQARKAMIVSGKPRLVARCSLNNTVVQIIVAKPHGDEVLASAHSRELMRKYGWKAATGNVPAAYLTGLLCGLKAKASGVTEAILDIGLVKPVKGCKVFSALSGVVDAGVEVPHSGEEIVKERTRGFHIQDYAEGLGAPEEYAPKFSAYAARKLSPATFGDHFFTVRAAILTAYGMPVPKPEVKPVKVKKPEAKKPEVKKPEVKKVEVKPVAAKSVVVKPAEAKPVEVKPAAAKPVEKPVEVKPVEVVKPEVAPAKPAVKVEVAKVEVVEVRADAKPEVKAKAKAKPKAKAAAKKVVPVKAVKVKVEKAKVAPEVEVKVKPKVAAKKAPAKKVASKPKKSEAKSAKKSSEETA